MKTHYKYIVTWVVRGLSPDYWKEELTFFLPHLEEPDAVEIDALVRIVEQEGTWVAIDILLIQAVKVVEHDVYIIKPVENRQRHHPVTKSNNGTSITL